MNKLKSDSWRVYCWNLSGSESSTNQPRITFTIAITWNLREVVEKKMQPQKTILSASLCLTGQSVSIWLKSKLQKCGIYVLLYWTYFMLRFKIKMFQGWGCGTFPIRTSLKELLFRTSVLYKEHLTWSNWGKSELIWLHTEALEHSNTFKHLKSMLHAVCTKLSWQRGHK